MTARLLVVVPPDSDAHDTGRGHPERIGRVEAALAGVADAHLDDDVTFDAGRDATLDELTRVHDARYVDALDEFARGGGGMLDADTVVARRVVRRRDARRGLRTRVRSRCCATVVPTPGSWSCDRPVTTRWPPAARGFCLFNNVAVAAAALTARGERVLIVDWDVHHGNGTQDVFWDDPNVLFVSTHQYPAYPGTGRAEETGGAHARGLTINFPLPPGATGDVALAARRRRRRACGRERSRPRGC